MSSALLAFAQLFSSGRGRSLYGNGRGMPGRRKQGNVGFLEAVVTVGSGAAFAFVLFWFGLFYWWVIFIIIKVMSKAGFCDSRLLLLLFRIMDFFLRGDILHGGFVRKFLQVSEGAASLHRPSREGMPRGFRYCG